MKKVNPYFASLATGLLLWVSWPVLPFTLLVFVAWIPLFWLAENIEGRKKFFLLTYLAMFTWNVATTWWIWNASAPGAVSAFLANSFIMCLPWMGYRVVRRRLGVTAGFAALVSFWMSFEYIHLQDWGLSWPWLTLGNAFATHPEWVQWYEYTGASGGSLWILVVNIFLFLHLRQTRLANGKRSFRYIASGAGALVLPVFISTIISGSLTPAPSGTGNIVVVQPNIDPYEKVSNTDGSFDAQLQTLIRTTESVMDEQTTLVVWPETALYSAYGIDESSLQVNPLLQPLWSFLQRHPRSSLFTGVESIRAFDQPTRYSQAYGNTYLESYNGAVLLDTGGTRGFYHKSMLVPGVETLPWFLKFLGKWFDKFGGTTAGYAKQPERTVLTEKNGFRIAPAICYESIYGEFMREYVRNGANLICVVTNDGWWKKTPGHRQHMNYARLRAVETRTWVARSANTGISCFIDPFGKVIDPRPYDTQAAIKLSVSPRSNRQPTFFVRYGDLLSKSMLALAGLFLAWTLVVKFSRRNRAADEK